MRDENGVCPADNGVEHGYLGQTGGRIPRRLLGGQVISPGARWRRKGARLWTTPNGCAVSSSTMPALREQAWEEPGSSLATWTRRRWHSSGSPRWSRSVALSPPTEHTP